MVKKKGMDKLFIYIPQKKMGERPVERLIKLSEKRDRSINYLGGERRGQAFILESLALRLPA
jgi:hypothetical protein